LYDLEAWIWAPQTLARFCGGTIQAGWPTDHSRDTEILAAFLTILTDIQLG